MTNLITPLYYTRVYIHNITLIYASEYKVYMILSSPNWPMTRSFLENPELVRLFDARFNGIHSKKKCFE